MGERGNFGGRAKFGGGGGLNFEAKINFGQANFEARPMGPGQVLLYALF